MRTFRRSRSRRCLAGLSWTDLPGVEIKGGVPLGAPLFVPLPGVERDDKVIHVIAAHIRNASKRAWRKPVAEVLS